MCVGAGWSCGELGGRRTEVVGMGHVDRGTRHHHGVTVDSVSAGVGVSLVGLLHNINYASIIFFIFSGLKRRTSLSSVPEDNW